MPGNDTASENTLDSTFLVSTIDVILAKDSKKTIESIQLKKNDQPVKDTPNPTYSHGLHRIEYSLPLTLDPEDRISVLVNCSWPAPVTRKRVSEAISIDINLRDIRRMRDDQGVKSHRTKERNIEVLVNGHYPLLATTTAFIRSCERFRLLIIGNAGVGKSSLLHKVFGVEGVHTSGMTRGSADIDKEFISSTNERFVVHDSLGFEAGDEKNMDLVKKFVSQRKAMPELKDQLHAVWLCLELPYAGGRLLDGGVERFLRRRQEILGEIPLVVVLTKADQLDFQLELDVSANEDVEQYKSKYLDKYCIEPLHKAAGSDITHVAVSVCDGYSESLSSLVRATNENMGKYHVNEAPQVVASIAQRISIKEKITLSITIGKKKYWNMLLKCAVFHSENTVEYLRVIRMDIIAVWNFNDPHQCLMGDNITRALFRTDQPADSSQSPQNATSFTSFASVLGSALEAFKCLSGSGEVVLSLAGATADIAISTARTMIDAYRKAKGDAKAFTAYIVDLICIMQAIFLLTSGGRIIVTTKTVDLALRAYEQPRKIVHLMVDALDGKLGRDFVLDRIEELIWRYSIADHEIEELRRKIHEVLPPDS